EPGHKEEYSFRRTLSVIILCLCRWEYKPLSRKNIGENTPSILILWIEHLVALEDCKSRFASARLASPVPQLGDTRIITSTNRSIVPKLISNDRQHQTNWVLQL